MFPARLSLLFRLSLTSFTLAAVACGPADRDERRDDDDDGCGPDSSFNADHDHCDCDVGFSRQGTACLPEPEEQDEALDLVELDLTGAVVSGQSLTDDSGDAVYRLQAVADDVVLSIEGYVSFGAPEGPATIALSGAELSYATCAVCVRVETGCSAHGDHFHCEDTFMPMSGDVVFEALDPVTSLAGHLHELTLQPVTIDAEFETTPMSGQKLGLAYWDFATTLTAR